MRFSNHELPITNHEFPFDAFLTLICYKKYMTTPPYRSYLLRLWLEPNHPPEWRAMLESPSNGERHGFPNLQALFVFLEQETERLEQEQVNRAGRQEREV